MLLEMTKDDELTMLPARANGEVVAVTEWPSHDAAFKRVAEALRAPPQGPGVHQPDIGEPFGARPRTAPRG